jgi:hypothetical protein
MAWPVLKHIKRPSDFFLGACVAAWGIGFLRYLGYWVLFPWFPNVLDAAGLVLVGGYLLWRSFRPSHPSAP